ncbi:Outer membrane porin F precursor [Phycisphaerae bacterium RAS1]|nr:Outer membrane porin F precursor [Phycisphaerae bacterium RAS1]
MRSFRRDSFGNLMVGVAVFGLFGCDAKTQKDVEFRAAKAESEARTCQGDLAQERARTADLRNQIDARTREWEAGRAEVQSYKDRIAALTQARDQLAALIEKRGAGEMARPAIGASPLPTATDEALQTLAGRHAGRLWYDRPRGGVSVGSDRLFDPGSDVVQAEALALLAELAGVCAAAPADEFDIVVVGHTDDSAITKPESLAKHPSNWHLSVHRAIAVKDALVKAGVPAARVGVMGYGELRPVGKERGPNRRVEVFLAPRAAVQSFEAIRPPR